MRLRAAMIENIRTRVSIEEKRVMQEAACRRGLTLSEFIRETAAEAARRVAA